MSVSRNYFATTLLLLIVLLPSSAQEIAPSACEKFKALMSQRGLAISVKAQRDILLPGEAIEPIITLMNNSSGILEVPILNESSGIFVFPLQRKTNLKNKSIEYVGHVERAPDSTAATLHKFCSFPTADLQPGELREFPVRFPSAAWFDLELASTNSAHTGGMEEGQQRFLIFLGNIEIQGKYEVHSIQTNKSYCIKPESEGTLARRFNRRKDLSSIGDRCLLVSIVEQDGKWLLISSKSLFPINEYTNDLRRKTLGGNSANSDAIASKLYPAGGNVIAIFDQEPGSPQAYFPEVVGESRFVLIDRGESLGMRAIGERYRNRLATMDLSRPKATPLPPVPE